MLHIACARHFDFFKLRPAFILLSALAFHLTKAAALLPAISPLIRVTAQLIQPLRVTVFASLSS